MTSSTREISRKSSVARSYSSELGTVLEEQADDETDQTSAINRSINEQQAQNDTSSSFDGSEAMASLQSSPSQREIMKTKIKYHYMNPIQKFRARRRKPWKLVVQIVKVLLVTIQVRCSGWNYCTEQTFCVFIHKYKWLRLIIGKRVEDGPWHCQFLQHCKCQVNHNSEEIGPKIIARYPLSAEEQNENTKKSRWYALLHYLTEILQKPVLPIQSILWTRSEVKYFVVLSWISDREKAECLCGIEFLILRFRG